MKKKSLLLFIIILNNLFAVGEAGAIFLLISPGAGPQGAGEAQVAKVNDAYASYYNPSGLAFLKGREAVGMHVQWLPNLADDLYYEFLAYRHYIEGLGSVGGHVIYLNLGEQIGMDALGNPTSNWMSFMGAASLSFGTKLSETSSIGFNAKIFHQKLSEHRTEGEEGKGHSTDFAFDIGYLKKFKENSETLKIKKIKNIKKWFNSLLDVRDYQSEINDKIIDFFDNKSNIYDILEDQELLLDEIKIKKNKLKVFNDLSSYEELDKELSILLSKVDGLLDSLNSMRELKQNSEFMNEIAQELSERDDETIKMIDDLLIGFESMMLLQETILQEVDSMAIEESDEDKFNLGFCISNIGPKITFVDAEQADPSPTNMRMGLFAQLYNDGNNKLNFMFDANKLLVSRYQMMDWDEDGFVGGYDKTGNFIGIDDESAVYNKDGEKEYDSNGYFDDPWYLAIFTAWLDDWYYGGDFDLSGDREIGGYDCSGGVTKESLDEYSCDGGWVEDDNGKYGNENESGNAKIEKGTGNKRKFTDEFKNMIYNFGLEYWYTDNFVLRAGYIYDDEGKVINPTFGAGIRLLQYGFDFGYTAGEQGHPRANTMFFSINMTL
ncbi:MAG: PorV/PorQ family protein [Candidatus Neomarinimicrobiota bacterium]|nr:PorV/PorQ family protein [Candidatus Neomarinimicrobiota bacterium]